MRPTGVGTAILLAVMVHWGAVSSACRADRGPGTTVVATGASMAVVLVPVVDTCPASARRVTSLALWVDGKYEQEILLFPGSGSSAYETLVGPLPAGTHRVEVRPSIWWAPLECLKAGTLDVTTIDPGTGSYEAYRHAPVLELRADTVGEQTDVPLYSYVERLQGSGGEMTLRYSVVFSNEDGGTPTRALLARWGRTTDIEEVYAATFEQDRVVKEEFQGPDHAVRRFHGRRRGDAPVLLVATLNNMVIDRGRGVAAVRPVPAVVDLASATRESTMDSRPWVYQFMELERDAEGRIAADAPVDDQWTKRAPDAREHAFFEANVSMDRAVAAAWVEDRAGKRYWSHYGHLPMAVDRNAWVRVAVAVGPNPDAAISAAGWACLAAPDQPATGTCEIEATRVFALDAGRRPGPNRAAAGRFSLRAGGEARLVLVPAPPGVGPAGAGTWTP